MERDSMANETALADHRRTTAPMREALRASLEIENRADLHAHAGQFGPASELMKQANAIRAQVFGRGLDPNELRERTHAALILP
jgi:hypothetical protein